MKILFYQNSLKKDEVVSANVHIFEVLNNLSRLGHVIIYADGKHHSFTTSSLNEAVVQPTRTKSPWEKVKKIIWAVPFRGEALVAFYFIKEIKLFLWAFRTALHSRPDLIYRRHSFFNSEYLLSRIFKIPCVMEVNGLIGDETEAGNKGDALSLWLTNTIEKHNFKADKYIVVTTRLRELLFNEYKIPMIKIVVIGNGANTNLFRPMDMAMVKKELDLDPGNSYLCFVGSLNFLVGVKYFISAIPLILKEYPDARVLIVGEGSRKSALVSLSNQLDVADKVTFTGRVPYEKVPWYINASEMCVLPSPLSRRNKRIGTSALKLCEYLACEKPVVASRLDGCEFIEENDCGYLVKPASPEELAKAMIALLLDPVSKQRMGKNGRKYVLENQSWEIQSKKVAAVCENAIEENMKHRGQSSSKDMAGL
jgi:glycosyltransferase involved in cell wall biosynthesis